jgi:hypothetical protein
MCFSYLTATAVVPILKKLDGYAMQSEPIRSIEWKDDEILAIHFPMGNFRKVRLGWVLSVNGTPLAIFPD